MTMLGQTVGFPVPEGGAGELSRRPGPAAGGPRRRDPVLDAAVDADRGRVGRAAGVRTARRRAGRGAAGPWWPTSPRPHLYGDLLAERTVPDRVRRAMRCFQLDPCTVKVDWALTARCPGRPRRPDAPGTVHVADSVEQMTEALGQVAAGAVPARPFLLAGQMTTTDPTRSPAGTESMWAYTPRAAAGRAATPATRASAATWDHDDRERFADRMQARIERLAPGLRVPGSLRPPGARAARARGPQRQPGRRRDQRRHLPAAPAAGLPAGARLGRAETPVRGPLPGLGLGAPRGRRARGRRG